MNESSHFSVLIIDDNPAIRSDFIKTLNAHSSSALDVLSGKIFGEKKQTDLLPTFALDFASQGMEALDLVKKSIVNNTPYALAFVDIRMPPGWDGIETIQHIWEIDSNIQIVICTAYSDYSWEETVLKLGKKDNLLIVKKPFDIVAIRQLACAMTMKWALAKTVQQFTENLQQEVHEKTKSLEESITERESLETALERHIKEDELTGLPNRFQLLEKIASAIKIADESQSKFAVVFLDLNRFKLINDSLTHPFGDSILQSVAGRLKKMIRSQDTVARLGGDDFVILLTGIAENDMLKDKINRIISVFENPFRVEGRDIVLTVSIGVCFYPSDANTVDIALRNAEAAMYQAKKFTGNHFQYYAPEMIVKSLETLTKEAELHNAILRHEFFICYQPEIDLISNQLVSVEALIRWKHPKLGLLLPSEFIPLAEETGFIIPIGEWVMRTACQQIKTWQDAGLGLGKLRVAVNISPQQFRQVDLVKMIRSILQETALDPEYLEIELTENIIITNRESLDIVAEIKKIGVSIAVDDFGSGNSCLSYLRKIPLDRLKIDSAFVQNIQSTNDDEVVIRAVIALAKELKLAITAEGIETQDQLNFLKKNLCNDGQGFYFSQPLLPDEIEKWLRSR